MPPYSPRLDEHGFPIPATFDDPDKRRRRADFARKAFRGVLVLAFVLLIGGLLYELPLADGIPNGLKAWLANRSLQAARHKHARGDVQGALADIDRAAKLFPEHPLVRNMRGHFRLEANDVQGSLDDFNEVVRQIPNQAAGYLGRSVALQRLERYREAIDDLTKAIELSPSNDPTPRNNRAYARALAGIELDEAMVDVQQAIDSVDVEIREAAEQPVQLTAARYFLAQQKFQKAAYLDTRGYIYFLKNDYQPALADLDEAIQLSLEWQQIALPHEKEAERAALAQRLDHELSVMYHHRGQVLEKLGRMEEAQADLDHAVKLGYNPALGVF